MALFIVIFAVLSLLSTSISSPNQNQTTITASLSSFPHHRHSLHRLSADSLERARRLKEPTLLKTPLSPRGYGGYSVSLGVGSPPQAVPAIMDTGSSLVWVPCTSGYLCSGCSSGDDPRSRIRTFSPERSSSYRNVSCGDPQCAVVFGPGVESRCGGGGGRGGSEPCLAYLITYGSGGSFGFLIADKLDFGGRIARSFFLGCSVYSSSEPSGIAGFGRGAESLPRQLGVRKFSYCALSHRFDDKPKTTDLTLDTSGGDTKISGMTYTPFRKNPTRFKDYYYLTLRRVIVGDKTINVPRNYTVPGRDGNGGAIVDSGTTFTYMERPLFDRVAGEFKKRMSRFERAVDAETMSGLGPCYNLSAGNSVPKLTLVFKSGAKMVLPLADYFSMAGALCLTIVSDDAPAAEVVGPAIILGNYQQQDFYVEYDLENDRFGFKRKTCD